MLRALALIGRRLTGRQRTAGVLDPRLAPFLRGISIGALVGAAIAGSTIWSRRGRRDGERAP